MQIDVLFFEGCPNHEPTTALVRDVVRSLGLEASIREVEVRNADEAKRLRFFGSPTIQVDGQDLDPSVQNRADYSFSCRIYGESGSPQRALVERALREGAERAEQRRVRLIGTAG